MNTSTAAGLYDRIEFKTATLPDDGWRESALAKVDDFHRMQSLGLICKDGNFFPSVHYPPITMYPPINQEQLYKNYTLPSDGLLDIYAHLPFCARHCIFCHYPVKLGPQLAEKDKYISAFEKEMDLYMRLLGVDKIKTRAILVGGGTPTFLTIPQLKRFLELFTRRLDLSRVRQFNYDVDPVTLIGPEGLERLKIMRDYGVDRLTIGIQSFNNHILKLMNRHHGSKEALESIDNCLKAGYQVNIEFIYGYPGETIDNWAEVIKQAISTNAHEIQLYRLKIDAYGDFQGKIKKFKQIKTDEVPTTEEALIFKDLSTRLLNAGGFHENIRRVFSRKKPHFSHYAHNQCCELYDQIGLGLTAFSSLRDRFALNTQSFEEYYKLIEEGHLPVNRGYVRDHEEQCSWAVVLPLKNREVKKKRFWERTGVSLNNTFRGRIARLKAHGLVTENDRFLELTPLGAFFADEVCHQFHSQRWIPFPQDAYAGGPLNPYHEDAPAPDYLPTVPPAYIPTTVPA
jgi:oxygen-independent coproporphyrinogen III oxidase